MSELFTDMLRIVAPIALIGSVVLANRLIGLKYPLGALSCIAVFCRRCGVYSAKRVNATIFVY